MEAYGVDQGDHRQEDERIHALGGAVPGKNADDLLQIGENEKGHSDIQGLGAGLGHDHLPPLVSLAA